MCADVDECLKLNGCQQLCDNNQGSYGCNCTEGFELATDMKSCKGNHATSMHLKPFILRSLCFPVLTECATSPSCSQICAAVGSEDMCYCNLGYELDQESGSQCLGIYKF